MTTLRLGGAIAALALACLTTSCYRGTFAWDSYHNHSRAAGKGPNSPYLVGIDYGREDAKRGIAFNPNSYKSYYHDYASQTWFHNGYYEGYTTVGKVLPPEYRQSQRQAFLLGDEKGRCDRRLDLSENPGRHFNHVQRKNHAQFEDGYHRGYQLEGGPYPPLL